MVISWEDLLAIEDRASGINERLDGTFISIPTNNLEQLENKVEEWCKNSAGGNEEYFLKRLAWDGIGIDTVTEILQPARRKNRNDGLSWICFLNDIIQTAPKMKNQSYRFLDIHAPIPYEELLSLFVLRAVEKLKQTTGETKQDLLSDSVQQMLERALLKRLSKLAAVTLQFEFKVYRTYKKLLEEAPPTYSGFVNSLLERDLPTFFSTYPVLAKILSLVSLYWVEAISEFLERLDHDKQEIETFFFNGCKTGQIIDIEPQMSDFHNNGRTVIIATFANGQKLVYKPRDLGIEETYFNLLNWINKKDSLGLSLKSLKILNRQGYGWVEFVDHLPCKEKDETIRYYKRAGIHLCLFTLFNGTDFHYDNLIAHGEHPVPVDMEMLFSPFYMDGYNINIKNRSSSLLSTGLLPIPDDKGPFRDLNALAAGKDVQIPFKMPNWENINMDDMKYKLEDQTLKPKKNILYINGEVTSPYDYKEEIVSGFGVMYDFLMTHHKEFLSNSGPLQRFKNKKIRFVFRPTMQYAMYLNKSLLPLFLKDGIDFSIGMEGLSKRFLPSSNRPSLWPLLKEEYLSIQKMDIPYFFFKADSKDLNISNHRTIDNAFPKSAYELVYDTIQHLNESDKKNYLSKIAEILNKDELILKNEPSFISKEELLNQAILIAETVKKMQSSSIPFSQLAGFNLYAGSLGVALFYAAIAKVTHEPSFRDLVMKEIETFRTDFQGSFAENYADQYGIGVTAGIGSIIYSLVCIYRFLNDISILHDAERVAALITKERIDNDRIYDVMSGSAGAILGLLTLYESSGKEQFLELAITCGDHLLKHRIQSDSGLRAWENQLMKTPKGKLPTGFSHGAAGISYALSKLFHLTKNDTFKDAAKEAIEYEDRVFSTEFHNWPDYRVLFMDSSGNPNYRMNTWCHGGTGIGMTRLGIVPIWENKNVRKDISIALETAKEMELMTVDHLCCGNFGMIDFLLTASIELSDQRAYIEALNKTMSAIKRNKLQGGYLLSQNKTGNQMQHSFFRGLSGIGYELLRLAFHDDLPSVLLFE